MIYTHENITAPVPYDPTWVVELAEKVIPEEKEIIEALKECTTIVGFCGCGCGEMYFIDTQSKEWNHSYDIILERENDFDVIISVMWSKKIGSIGIDDWSKYK